MFPALSLGRDPPAGPDITQEANTPALRRIRTGSYTLWFLALLQVLFVVLAVTLRVPELGRNYSAADRAAYVTYNLLIAGVYVALGSLIWVQPGWKTGSLVMALLFLNSVAAHPFALAGLFSSAFGDVGMATFYLGMALNLLAMGTIAASARAAERLEFELATPNEGDHRGWYLATLARLLARIMLCDSGLLNKEERRHFLQVMRTLGLKGWLAHAMLRRADASTTERTELVNRYLQVAERLGLPDPKRHLLEHLLAAAQADGPNIEEEEKGFLLAVARQMGVQDQEVVALLSRTTVGHEATEAQP